MSLNIVRMPSGPLETNAYLVADTVSGDAILVDAPLDIAPQVRDALQHHGAQIRALVITHGHWDHILGAADIVAEWNVPVLGHARVRERLEDAAASPTSPVPMRPVVLETELVEGSEITVGAHRFGVMHMPGHDVAHITLYSAPDGVVLGGDVLFQNGHGRTDLPGSDQLAMNKTLRRFLQLPPETRVLPGHGEETTVERESQWIRNIPE